MKFLSLTLSFIILNLALRGALSHDPEFHCIHDEVEKFPLVFDDAPEGMETSSIEADNGFLKDGRILQTSTFRPITFKVAFDYLLSGHASNPYIMQLVNSAVDYSGRLLSVSETPYFKKLSATSQYCLLTPPTTYTTLGTGVYEDVLILVASETTTTSYVASGQPCAVIGTAKRPYVVKLTFNTNFVYASTTAYAVNYNTHLAATIHEFIHMLGFSPTLFSYFPNTNRSTTTKADNGYTRSYIKIGLPEDGLQDELQSYFGCNSIPGAILEQQGTVSAAGGHWERRVFDNEIMTATLLRDMRITNVTLKFLGNMGWYKVNYKLAHPAKFGKGKGCDFYEGPCYTTVGSGISKFTPEYCNTLGQKECSFTRKQGAFCGTSKNPLVKNTTLGSWNFFNFVKMDDIYGDNTPSKIIMPSKDCEDSTMSKLSFEYAGRDSRCFAGTIYTSSSAYAAQTAYCLKYNCTKNAAGSWVLNLFIKNSVVSCTTQGKPAVSGLKGWIECPDPNEFCADNAEQTCRFNCYGRGTCNTTTGTCTCESGFKGDDCGQLV